MLSTTTHTISPWPGLRRICAALAGAAVITGCHAGHPSPEQVKQVNGLVQQRVAVRWDVQQLFSESAAVPEATGPLTLEKAIEQALRHNLSLIASAENLSIAHAQLVQAGLIQNPSLGQSNGFLFPISPHTGLPSMDGNISMVLNSIFTQPARVSVARVQELQANIDMATQAYALVGQVDGKYQELVHLVRARRLLLRIQDLYARAVDAAEARQKVGVVPTPELNRARLNYEDARRQVRHVTTQYQRAAREMNYLMGDAGAPHWTEPQSAGEEVKLLPSFPDVEHLEQLGLQYRLDLLRASFDSKISEHQVTLAKIGIVPQVSVGFEIARDGQKNLIGGPYIPTLTLPIFDPGLVALELARAQLRKARKTWRALEGQVHQDVRTAYENWRIAADDVDFFREHLIPQQEQNVRLMELSFRLGNDDLDTLLNVYQSYVSQLQAYEDALQAYHDSTVALQQAVGVTWERIVSEQPTTAPRAPATSQPAATLPVPSEHE